MDQYNGRLACVAGTDWPNTVERLIVAGDVAQVADVVEDMARDVGEREAVRRALWVVQGLWVAARNVALGYPPRVLRACAALAQGYRDRLAVLPGGLCGVDGPG